MMAELVQIREKVSPTEIFFVADAMTGQDAVNVALQFHQQIQFTGVVLTKMDGDARGGAALSIKEVTGKPIKFLGLGESLDRLEEFRPEGLASRILGFGDVVGLMKDFEQHVDAEQAEVDARKLLTGDFSLEDFVNQIQMVRKMGPLGELMEKFPLFGDLPEGFKFDDQALEKIVAMIGSMTRVERQRPDTITEPRVKRIARGSGRTEKEVKDLLKQYNAMRTVMKQVGSAPGLLSRLPGIKNLMNLRNLQGKGMEDVLGANAGAMEQAMGDGMDQAAMARAAGLPRGYTPAMPAAARARARLMGFSPEPVVTSESAKDREARQKKRKAERQARKKARKGRR
jgi:signal recognition particle subunit SRP54